VLRFSIKKNEKIDGDYCLLTVPLSVLQASEIEFIPSLPAAKKEAFNQFYMGSASKLTIQFKNKFWNNHRIVICLGSPVAQFWTNDTPILTAFIAGPHARSGIWTEGKLLTHTLQLLDEIYGNGVASSAYVNHLFFEWHNVPYIRGSYSSAKPGSTVQHRRELSKPLIGRVFFSGEHTSRPAPSTITGAMHSAELAVEEIKKASHLLTSKL